MIRSSMQFWTKSWEQSNLPRWKEQQQSAWKMQRPQEGQSGAKHMVFAPHLLLSLLIPQMKSLVSSFHSLWLFDPHVYNLIFSSWISQSFIFAVPLCCLESATGQELVLWNSQVVASVETRTLGRGVAGEWTQHHCLLFGSIHWWANSGFVCR